MKDLLRELMAYLRHNRNASGHTIRAYESDITQYLLSACKERDCWLSDLTPADLHSQSVRAHIADTLKGLDPARTHVYLCGNPSMIGLPEWEDDEPRFPERTGVSQLLHEQGFRIDRRGSSGNVHYEEYW